jgi:hypothetical protein
VWFLQEVEGQLSWYTCRFVHVHYEIFIFLAGLWNNCFCYVAVLIYLLFSSDLCTYNTGRSTWLLDTKIHYNLGRRESCGESLVFLFLFIFSPNKRCLRSAAFTCLKILCRYVRGHWLLLLVAQQDLLLQAL